MDIHKKKAEGKQYVCKDINCGKRFATLKQANLHFKCLHAEKSLPCDECDQTFSLPSRLKQHVFTKHSKLSQSNQRQRITCEVCGITLASKSIHKTHVKKVHGSDGNKDLVSCPECPKKFEYKSSMTLHFKKHHCGDELKTHKCDICEDRTFVSIALLNYHIKYNHTAYTKPPPKRNPVKCPIAGCDHIAGDQTQLKVHLNSLKHASEKNFECSKCSETFTRKYSLKVHVDRVHFKAKRPMGFKCFLCGRGFYYSMQHEKHSKLPHNQDCEFCELKFTTTKYHLDHRRKVHSVNEPLNAKASSNGDLTNNGWSNVQIKGSFEENNPDFLKTSK